MSAKQISSSTIALVVAALFMLGVGTYTDNGGFQLAGGLLLVVGIIQVVSQVGGGSR